MPATSAIFSIVLGLALQEPLGNLFSGVSMQIGGPFKIGDWIEVNSEARKWVGQVQEINWRATFLSSFSNEWIVIPNKAMAQSQTVVLTNSQRSLRHSQLFRVGFDENLSLAKKILLDTVREIEAVTNEPPPKVLVVETTESWISLKVFYSLKDFSGKHQVADLILSKALARFAENQIRLATSQLTIEKNRGQSNPN